MPRGGCPTRGNRNRSGQQRITPKITPDGTTMISAYYSNELKSWVRLERCEDGEYCHTSGYDSKDDALGKNIVPYRSELPAFLMENSNEVNCEG